MSSVLHLFYCKLPIPFLLIVAQTTLQEIIVQIKKQMVLHVYKRSIQSFKQGYKNLDFFLYLLLLIFIVIILLFVYSRFTWSIHLKGCYYSFTKVLLEITYILLDHLWSFALQINLAMLLLKNLNVLFCFLNLIGGFYWFHALSFTVFLNNLFQIIFHGILANLVCFIGYLKFVFVWLNYNLLCSLRKFCFFL